MNQTEEEINKALNKKMGLEDTLEQVSNETVVIHIMFCGFQLLRNGFLIKYEK